ncbi:MAG: hypothetical protein OHK0047_31180 [Leptolyngbyaceae cyanobacterium]
MRREQQTAGQYWDDEEREPIWKGQIAGQAVCESGDAQFFGDRAWVWGLKISMP